MDSTGSVRKMFDLFCNSYVFLYSYLLAIDMAALKVASQIQSANITSFCFIFASENIQFYNIYFVPQKENLKKDKIVLRDDHLNHRVLSLSIFPIFKTRCGHFTLGR